MLENLGIGAGLAALAFWGCAALAMFALGLYITLPLQEFALLISQILTSSLIDLGEGWLTFFLAPINNIASILVVGGKMCFVRQL